MTALYQIIARAYVRLQLVTALLWQIKPILVSPITGYCMPGLSWVILCCPKADHFARGVLIEMKFFIRLVQVRVVQIIVRRERTSIVLWWQWFIVFQCTPNFCGQAGVEFQNILLDQKSALGQCQFFKAHKFSPFEKTFLERANLAVDLGPILFGLGEITYGGVRIEPVYWPIEYSEFFSKDFSRTQHRSSSRTWQTY